MTMLNDRIKPSKWGIIVKIIKDLKNGTSHSVDFLLSNNVEETLSKKGIKIRKLISPILKRVYLTQTKYKLIKEKDTMKLSKGNKIFVTNHRQADDIVLGANAIKNNSYVLFGNPDLTLETTNGLGLWANGIILLNRDNKENRKASYNKMKYVLENGGNIWLFPEGYWNLDDNGLSDERHGSDDHNSENWLIQDINIGSLKLAQETGVPIVPTIMHYDEVNGRKCYSKRGKDFYIGKDDDLFKKKDELLEIMNTMYYELMEKYSTYKRADLEKEKTLKEQWEELKQELIRACDIPSINYKLDLQNEKLIGKAKVANPVVTNEEAFKHIDELEPNHKTAFLKSKRLSGRR